MNALPLLALLSSLAGGVPDEFGADVVVGKKPPPLVLDKLLQAPAGVTAESLSAGPAVVEFWATWCQPCVEQIPHLNDLQLAMQGRALSFVAVTAEDEEKVAAFLHEHPMGGAVGLEGKKARNWGVRMLPTSVLVDAQGRIAAVVPPQQLTPRVLQRLLNGEPLFADTPPPAAREQDALLRAALWRAADNDDEDFEHDEHHLRARRVPLSTLVAAAHGVEPWQVQLGPGVEDAPYHLSVAVPGDRTGRAVDEVARDTLARALGLKFSKSRAMRSVVVLSRARKPSPSKKPAPSTGGAQLSFHPGSPAMLVEALRPLAHDPVVDESGLSSFDLELHDVRDLAAVKKDLQAQLGVEMKPAKKKFDIVRVDRR